MAKDKVRRPQDKERQEQGEERVEICLKCNILSEKVLHFEGMAEGGQKRSKRIVIGLTRDKEWAHTVANVVS